ncbi:MAG TPA: hypothetical protein VFD27_21195 [Chthoniobacteraceae bacterium]|jgi:hypothetical protein|nr:hypothetical protein [Chthoniobacteraceae bacterium]
MNDDELKACLAKLRIPPCDDAAQSAALNRALEALGHVEELQLRWTWRDWLWPSPLAWGALAAIWVLALARESASSPGLQPEPAAIAVVPSQSRSPFFARAEYQELLRQFQQSQSFR